MSRSVRPQGRGVRPSSGRIHYPMRRLQGPAATGTPGRVTPTAIEAKADP